MKAAKLIPSGLRSLGYEVIPYPPTDWVRTRDILRRVLNELPVDCVLDVGQITASMATCFATADTRDGLSSSSQFVLIFRIYQNALPHDRRGGYFNMR